MYCNSCGKPNPEGSAFCSSCGKPLAPTPATPPTPAQPVRPTTPPVSAQASAPKLMDFRSHFRSSWREFVVTPLALALIICHSVSVLLGIIELNTTMESLEMMFDAMSLMGSSSGDFGNFLLTLMQIMLVAPGVLIAVGLWMLYMDARDQSNRPLSISGLKLIKGVYGVQMALFCLFVFILFCSSCSAAQELNDSGYLATAAKTAMETAMAVVVIVGGLGIALFWIVIKFIILVQDCAELCEPNTKYVKGFAVFEFISGGISVLAMLSTGLTLSTAVSCAMPFLFGAVLLKYKEMMETLSWMQIQYDLQYEETRTLSSLKTQNGQQTVQNQYIPAWKRVELEKIHPDGWHCINCGSHNDPDAIYCVNCGGTERQ